MASRTELREKIAIQIYATRMGNAKNWDEALSKEGVHAAAAVKLAEYLVDELLKAEEIETKEPRKGGRALGAVVTRSGPKRT